MIGTSSLNFASPGSLAVAAVLLLAIGLLGLRRSSSASVNQPSGGPRRAAGLLIAGTVFLALSAGEPFVYFPHDGTVAVMIDLSPSTRGATFRDPAVLPTKIRQLLGSHPYRLYGFADGIFPLLDPADLRERACEQTVFSAPSTDAVVLFSDGRFSLPAVAPPVYVVIDPALDNPPDAAVMSLDWRDNHVAADLRPGGSAILPRWTGATPDSDQPIASEVTSIAKPTGGRVSVSINGNDRWPENDSLSLDPPPPVLAQRWWVGERNPGPGWVHWRAADLPSDPLRYLDASIIVLDNQPADAVSALQQIRLAQYVRDTGGGLLILGGDRAFAAGGYDGTDLGALSPLDSSPPQAVNRWVLVVDSSGSMAVDSGDGISAFFREASALLHLLPGLPPNDRITIGSFSDSLHWWVDDSSAKQAALVRLPPPTAIPNGPTNLQAVLDQLSRQKVAQPTNVLLMTDAQADLSHVDELAKRLRAGQIRISVLAIGNGSALSALKTISQQTGGTILQQPDARQWQASAQELTATLRDRQLHADAILARFDPSIGLTPRRISNWNRTWLKPGASRLADADADAADGQVPLAARWAAGAGQVMAVAFSLDVADATSLANTVAMSPRDPRLNITWVMRTPARVRVRASEGGHFINGLSIQLASAEGTMLELPQVAPGEYELILPRRTMPWLATLRLGARIIDRRSIAGRYAPEFDRIGNDYAGLTDLVRRTGGAIVQAGKPIDFRWPSHRFSLASPLACAAAVLLLLGLVARHLPKRPVG